MFSWVSGAIGLVAAVIIIYLVRRDHLRVRYGIWWLVVAAAFLVFGFWPQSIDRLAANLGVAYGPVLALTIGLTVFVIKLLTIDIARSRNETRIVRLVQRVAMLESELERLKRSKGEDAGPDGIDKGADRAS